jgi:hypothetical protein
MARPTIFDRPMTAAERMQRYRERKRHPLPEPDTITEALRRTTPKNRARYVGRSVRSLHYIWLFALSGNQMGRRDSRRQVRPLRNRLPGRGVQVQQRRRTTGRARLHPGTSQRRRRTRPVA